LKPKKSQKIPKIKRKWEKSNQEKVKEAINSQKNKII